MAMTGYYRTLRRPRTSRPLSMLKYDPVGTLNPVEQIGAKAVIDLGTVRRQVLFLEQKRGGNK